MSHITQLKKCFHSKEAIVAGMKEIGLELREKSTYNWWGKWVGDSPFPDHIANADEKTQKQWIEKLGTCDFCFGIPGDFYSFEVGVRKREDGQGYEVLWDWYGGRGWKIQEMMGENGRKFSQSYTQNLLLLVAAKKGHKAKRGVKWGECLVGEIEI